MYKVYIENILLPVAPENIKMTNVNQNYSISLANEEEFNVLKAMGLTSYQFAFLLPRVKYNFAVYENDIFCQPSYFTEKLLQIKSSKSAVDFTIITDDGNMDFTNKLVTIEDYNLLYTSDGSGDVEVSITLKDYVSHQTKLISIVENTVTSTTVVRPTVEQTVYETYTIKSGDTLTSIAKCIYNNIAYVDEIYQLNKTLLDQIAVSRGYPAETGHWWIFAGTVINLP